MKFLLRLLAWTLKLDGAGWEHVATAMKSGRPMILVTWHGNIVSVLTLRFRIQLPLLIAMVSQSKDGDMATAVMSRLGGMAVRGSSSRGGARAVLGFKRTMKKELESTRAVAGLHLLDGPRGPRHEVKPGIVAMAQLCDALIVPLLSGAEPCVKFRSWDRHFVPLPFAKFHYRFGPPIDLCEGERADETREAGGESSAGRSKLSVEAGVARVEREMKALEASDPVIARSLGDDRVSQAAPSAGPAG